MAFIDHTCVEFASKPYIDGCKVLAAGKVSPWAGEVADVTSPIIDKSTGQRVVIGRMAQMNQVEAMRVADAAQAAWNKGRGEWPQTTLQQRIDAIYQLVAALKEQREAILQVLMWEICKTAADAAAEFDRTMAFIEASIQAVRDMVCSEGDLQLVSGICAKMRRGPVGVMLAIGPFNYPFNETYTILIPALLMGNVVIMKIPTVGGLAHVLTMHAYACSLPPGVVNFVSGAGRVTMAPIMERGDVDIFAFIGSSKAADALLQSHPAPHRLKIFLSLEGKNLAIIAPDADLDVAAEQCAIGSTAFNGQRCTAIKLVFVHEQVADTFVQRLCQRIALLKAGLPWEQGVAITPLPEPNKISFINDLVNDAVSKGAVVVNAEQGGGMVLGNLFCPAVLYPVTSAMRLWDEEQFGPVVPVAVYRDHPSPDSVSKVNDVHDYVMASKFGQQAALFSSSPTTIAAYIDLLGNAVGRININTQCGRSPDTFPFSGRRSSANGTLSVTEALKIFSIETVVAGKANATNEHLMQAATPQSSFLAAL